MSAQWSAREASSEKQANKRASGPVLLPGFLLFWTIVLGSAEYTFSSGHFGHSEQSPREGGGGGGGGRGGGHSKLKPPS